jgi:hypothetical protein
MASQTPSHPAPAPPVAPAAEARLCEGCGLPLVGQKPGARHHSAVCRQAAYRKRRRAEVLGVLARIEAEVARLKADVERW